MKAIKHFIRKIKNDQSGLTLMVVMLFLFLMTILGMTMYFMSNTDLKISRNLFRGTRAFYASEAGISEAIGKLNLNSSDPNYDALMFDSKPYNTSWRYPPDPDITDSDIPKVSGHLDNDDEYEYYLRFKMDDKDLDGDTITNEIVTYDKGFFTNINYPNAGEGYPVVEIESTGYSSDGESIIVLEISKIPLDVKANGAVSANSDVHVQGNFEANGFNHDMDGNLVGSGDVPGVITTIGNETTKQGSADIYGDPPYSGSPEAGTWDPTAVDGEGDLIYGPFPNSPEEALGLTGSMTDMLDPANVDYYGPYDGSIGMNSGSPLSGITYITNDYPGPKENGSGILIIHNPNFDPCKYDASKVFTESGGATVLPCYDASYDHTDPNNQPAKLGDYTSNATFKGLIIADVVDKIAGTPTIIGALISLSSIDINILGTGNATILYSSEALNNFASAGFSKKISWHKE
jgi:hypothetical protein